MKSTIIMAVFLLMNLFTFSQTNKPTTGDLGIHYGVYFNGALNQQLALSGMLKKNLEVGAGITFSFSQNKNQSSDSIDINTLSGQVRGTRDVNGHSTIFNIALNPFLLYHFPTKNNLDVYAGGSVSVGVVANMNDVSTTKNIAANYEQTQVLSNYHPLGISGGITGILGCQFFFYKNVAIGAQGGLGFNVVSQNGRSGWKTETSNSGSENPDLPTVVLERSVSFKNLNANIAVAGNVGLNLKFYFSRKEKVKS